MGPEHHRRILAVARCSDWRAARDPYWSRKSCGSGRKWNLRPCARERYLEAILPGFNKFGYESSAVLKDERRVERVDDPVSVYVAGILAVELIDESSAEL